MERLLSQATPDERDELLSAIDSLQVKDTQTLFNSMSARCFTRCVHHFRSRTLDSTERACIDACALKYLLHIQRCGQRFSEETMMLQRPA